MLFLKLSMCNWTKSLEGFQGLELGTSSFSETKAWLLFCFVFVFSYNISLKMRITALYSRLAWCSLNHSTSLNQKTHCPQPPGSLRAVGGGSPDAGPIGTEVEGKADYLGKPFPLSLLPRPRKDKFSPLRERRWKNQSGDSNDGYAQCTQG